MNKKDMLNNKYAKDIREMIERNILSRKSNMPISHLSLLCAKSKRFIEKEGETLDLKGVVPNNWERNRNENSPVVFKRWDYE